MPLLSQQFHQALELASRLHEDQPRKGGMQIPYVAHLLGVTSRVLKASGSESQAIAALLHDAIEDQGHKISAEQIREQFGQAVAKMVVECTDAFGSEKETLDWWDRKNRYLRRIATLNEQTMLVVVADKLENATDILWDLEAHGEIVWQRFNQGSKGEIWFYSEVARILDDWSSRNVIANPSLKALISELKRTVLNLQSLAQNGRA